jgi:AcrR family transcriptional regulator
MSKPKDHEPDSPKRDAILGAALELFAERGFHGTAVPLIAERAGVGAGTVYRYFESKEAIVNALFQQHKEALMTALIKDLPIGAPTREVFHQLFRRMGRFAVKHPRVMAFLELHHHGGYLDDKSREVEMALLLPLRAFVVEAQRQQVLKPVAAELLIALVWGGFVGMLKASWMGHLELTTATIDAAESCLWEAIRR